MQLGNWTNSTLFGCNLMSVKVFVEVVTALLFNASNVGLSVALLFKLLENCHKKYVLSLIRIYFAKPFRSLYYQNVRSRFKIIKYMEPRLREFQLTLCVLMPTYTLLRFFFQVEKTKSLYCSLRRFSP